MIVTNLTRLFSENNVWRDFSFHEFIGIQWCQNKSSVQTFKYSRRNMVSLFFLTKTLPQRDLSHWGFNFLQIRQESVAREDHPSLSLTPLHGLPLTLASRLCYGRARILTRSSNASVVWMMLSSPQASKPPSSVQGSSWFPRQVNISLPIFPCPAPKTWFEDGLSGE